MKQFTKEEMQQMQARRKENKEALLKKVQIEPRPYTGTLDLVERETVIIYNQREDTAYVETWNAGLRTKLMKEGTKKNSKCKILKLWDDGYGSFEVPKKWIKVNAGKDGKEDA